jgi:hypothetical protein
VVFLDVAKAFATVWIDGLLYELMEFNFPSYLVHTISSYVRDRTFEASFLTATSSRRLMLAGVAQGGLNYPVHFSLHGNDLPISSHHIEFALKRGRDGHHSHVPQADAARQLPGVLSQ